jgi:hypothetical protein
MHGLLVGVSNSLPQDLKVCFRAANSRRSVTGVRPIAAVQSLKCRRLAAGYNHGYTAAMKTAISIPDAIFEEAERLAKIRGWSRSELYSNAVSAYVNSERFLGVREKLDAVYGQNVDDSVVDQLLAKAQARSLPKEKW